MKKEFFEEVQMEVVLLDIEEDIVTTSDGGYEDGGASGTPGDGEFDD